MNTLITALMNGTVSTNADGTINKHPPTNLHLHASRAIKQLAEINNGNQDLLMRQQQQLDNLQQENFNLLGTIRELQDRIQELSVSKPEVKAEQAGDQTPRNASGDSSVCEDQGQASEVDGSSNGSSGSNSDSDGRGTS